ncbi:TNT domain-containing protein [Heyndrickxia sporothermodurans]|uniref:TNT domain-containing protein n=1 Tax=Heyndrickxia sporothermodurans TaxID=46224 RepID=UPI002E244B69|nr:TNT domain-containing protein [Heyndrickxia sporothermodurans]MED3696372.1 TNT domain-containing protein [Heyndrickxia sporothermodurans]
MFRGLLSPLDIIPGVSSITKFSGAVKLAHLGDMGQFAVKTGIKSSIQDSVTHIGNMVETAGKVSATRLKSAASAIKDGGTAIKNKVVEDAKDIGKLVGTGINKMTNIIPSRKLGLVADGMGDVGHAHIPVDEARVVGNEKGDVVSRIDGVNLSGGKNIDTLVDDLLKKSTCNVDELTGYLKQIDKYNGTNYADEFVSLGKWPDDIQIPKDSKVLNADGSINWSEVPNGGYVLDKNGNAIKEVFVPKIGDIIDRYGPPNGRYTSPVMDGKPYDYGQRSLPYIEDVTKYHQYEVTGDFSRLKDYVMNCNDMKLKVKVEAQIERYYNGDYSKVIAQKGEIAKGFGSPGGGIQYELPIPVEWLEGLGMLREIK